MRTAALALLVLLLPVTFAGAQPVGTPPPGSGATMPPMSTPAGATPMHMPGQPASATPGQPYPYWMQEDLPEQTLQYLKDHPPLLTALAMAATLGRPLTFLCLFLFIGGVFAPLARKVLAPAPAPKTGYATPAPDPALHRRLATVTLVVWAVALGAACDAVGSRWMVEIVGEVARLLSSTITILLIVLAAVYALVREGRDVVLSLIGWASLKWYPERPQPGQEFDLGDGKRGKLQRVGLLHTTFDLGSGQVEVRPNAWLMREYFHWSV